MKKKYSNKSSVIADPVGFVRSIDESEKAYGERYLKMGMAYAMQLINLAEIDYHTLYAFNQIVGKIRKEEFDGDVLTSIKELLLAIGKETLWTMIHEEIIRRGKDDLTLDTKLFAVGLAVQLKEIFKEFKEKYR